MNLLRLQTVLFVCLVFLASTSVAESLLPPEIIPAGHKWTVTHRVAGENRVFHFPDDYPTVEKLPAKDRLQILDEARHFERNIEHVRKVGRAFYSNPGLGHFEIFPDADVNLRDVVVATGEQDALPLEKYEAIFSALPMYTRVHVVVLEGSVENARRELLGIHQLERTNLHSVNGWFEKTQAGFLFRRPTRWVRDAFLPGRDGNGDSILFFPMAYSNIIELDHNDLTFFKGLAGNGRQVVGLPIFVRGGNIELAKVGNERILFLGERELRYNTEVFIATTQFRPSDDMMLDILKNASGANRIVVLPNSDHLFHLDMVMTVPRSGMAAVIAPLDPENLDTSDLAVIKRVRSELAKLGMQQISVPTTAARIAAFESVVNGVAFKNLDTGRPSFLLPEYLDETVHVNGQRKSESLNQLIRNAYEHMSITVIPLEDRFFTKHGNTHCVIVGL